MSDSSAASDKLGESPAIQVTGKIMLMAIIVLFMVVVSFLGFHLFARGFWWRTPPSPRRRRRFVFGSGQDGALRGGLDPSVLRSLPVLEFQPQDFKDGLECAVCLSELVQGEKARLLPQCNHGFHVDCIDMWFQSHATCPICRAPVVASDNNESSSAAQVSDESPTFPTNVLIWGNHTQISSGSTLEESTCQPPCSSSGGSCSNTRDGMLTIDIPSGSGITEDELKSPSTGRLRSLKRLLSRGKRLNPLSPTSTTDVEQAKGAQS